MRARGALLLLLVSLAGLGALDAARLLALELVVKQEEGLLAAGGEDGKRSAASRARGRVEVGRQGRDALGLGCADDGEHALARLVVRDLSDADL